ncbi:MAG: ATP-binding protein [Nevskiales bacterium]
MAWSLGTTPIQTVRSLFWLRWISVFGLLVAFATAHFSLQMPLPWLPLLLTCGVLALWNAAVWFRLRRGWPATEPEVVLHLVLDGAALTVLLYFAGGATNPFVSLYLVPLAIAAAALSARYAWAIAALCIGGYTLLMYTHRPLPHMHGEDFNLHVLGMWLNFILSGLLIAGFVTAMAAGVRARDRALAQAREEALRNEQILALGTLAAGAAHELSTPLSTMLVTVGELERDCHEPVLRADLALLREQIALCKQKLSGLLSAHGVARGEPLLRQPLRHWLEVVVAQWRILRPECEPVIEFRQPFAGRTIVADPALAQTFGNILDNAADASKSCGSAHIGLRAATADACLILEVEDEGPGLNEAQREQAGRLFFTTKPQGFGLGLVLSNAVLARIGGELTLTARTGGGVCARVRVPLAALEMAP